jgi:DNA primase
MDAIALAEAGFPQTVAPLGTALTEDQLRLLWRMAPEPVLCFDGDAAGRRAAFRAVETVLPHLKPGLSLRFAFLADGLDPDDFIRERGAAAFQAVLDTRLMPLFDVLMQREEQAQPGITPEQRASLEARLKSLIARIGDTSVRQHYEAELRQTLWEKNRRLVREIAGTGGRRDSRLAGKRRDNAALDWRAGARADERSRLGGTLPRAAMLARGPARSNELAERLLPLPAREALILCTLLNHPLLLEARCEDVAELALTAPPLALLRDALLSLLAQHSSLDREEMRTQLTKLGLDKVVAMAERAISHRSDKFAQADSDPASVESGWSHAVALHQAQVGLRRALDAAEREWRSDPSPEAWSRIAELQQRLASGIEADGHGDA